jgi:hypothetical protein
VGPARGRPGRARLWQAAGLALVAALAIAAVWYVRTPRDAPPELRLQIVTPPSPAPTSIALSPDGRHLVFIASSGHDQPAELWLRDLNTVSNRRLAGTAGASFPFWSADSRSIGFFADSKLHRYDLAGGAVETLAAAPLGRGGTWNRDGVIVFAPTVGALFRVQASGGEPERLTTVQAPHETSHRFPQFLPDGQRFLYFAQGSTESQGVYVASLDQPSGRRLFAADAHAVFAPPDTVLFLRQGTAFAQRLDLTAGSPRGRVGQALLTLALWPFMLPVLLSPGEAAGCAAAGTRSERSRRLDEVAARLEECWRQAALESAWASEQAREHQILERFIARLRAQERRLKEMEVALAAAPGSGKPCRVRPQRKDEGMGRL